jgi:hypothetical protein
MNSPASSRVAAGRCPRCRCTGCGAARGPGVVSGQQPADSPFCQQAQICAAGLLKFSPMRASFGAASRWGNHERRSRSANDAVAQPRYQTLATRLCEAASGEGRDAGAKNAACAAVTAHPRERVAVGDHRRRAQRGTSCSAVIGASSAVLRRGECLAPSHFSHEPSSAMVVFSNINGN